MRTLTLLCVALFSLSAFAQAQPTTTPPPAPQPAPQPQQQPQYQPQPYPYAQPQYQPQPYPYAYPPPQQPAQPYRPLRIDNWKEGDPIPEGYKAVSRPRMGLVVGGAITFGVPYFISVLGGAIALDTGSPNYWPLLVPVVGPFIQAGFVPSATEKLLFVLDGIAQVGGVAMFIIGLAVPNTYLVRTQFAWLMPTPIFTRGGAGVGLAGGF